MSSFPINLVNTTGYGIVITSPDYYHVNSITGNKTYYCTGDTVTGANSILITAGGSCSTLGGGCAGDDKMIGIYTAIDVIGTLPQGPLNAGGIALSTVQPGCQMTLNGVKDSCTCCPGDCDSLFSFQVTMNGDGTVSVSKNASSDANATSYFISLVQGTAGSIPTVIIYQKTKITFNNNTTMPMGLNRPAAPAFNIDSPVNQVSTWTGKTVMNNTTGGLQYSVDPISSASGLTLVANLPFEIAAYETSTPTYDFTLDFSINNASDSGTKNICTPVQGAIANSNYTCSYTGTIGSDGTVDFVVDLGYNNG